MRTEKRIKRERGREGEGQREREGHRLAVVVKTSSIGGPKGKTKLPIGTNNNTNPKYFVPVRRERIIRCKVLSMYYSDYRLFEFILE